MLGSNVLNPVGSPCKTPFSLLAISDNRDGVVCDRSFKNYLWQHFLHQRKTIFVCCSGGVSIFKIENQKEKTASTHSLPEYIRPENSFWNIVGQTKTQLWYGTYHRSVSLRVTRSCLKRRRLLPADAHPSRPARLAGRRKSAKLSGSYGGRPPKESQLIIHGRHGNRQTPWPT